MRLRLVETFAPDAFARLFQGATCEANRLPIPRIEDTCETWLTGVRAGAKAGLAYVWLMEPEQGVAVGTVRIGAICRRTQSGQLSYWVAPPHRGHGHATRAAAIATTVAFTGAGMKHLDTWIEPGNRQSLRIVARLGFRRLPDRQADASILHFRMAAADFEGEEDQAMLVIREDQLQAFREDELGRLARTIVDAVSQKHPAVIQRLTPQGALEIAKAAVVRARTRYHFEDKHEIAAVVKLSLCIGPYFDLWPKAHRIFMSPETPKRKFAALNEAFSVEDWEAAAAYAPPVG